MLQFVCVILLVTSALSRHIPRYAELDEEEQQLFRAAYDTPAYDHDEYEEGDDLPAGRLDLVKDGLWALKAKIKELKAFDKALAANMLSTRLKLKDLVDSKLVLKKHHHVDDKKKPYYSYQAPPSYQQYEPYHAPAPQYPAPAPQYGHDPYYGH